MAKRAPEQPSTHLLPADLHAMLLADRDLVVARLTLQRDEARLALAAAQAEAQLAKMRAGVAAATAQVAQASTAHTRLVADVAARYRIDWRHTSFRPEDGSIVPLPLTES